MKWIIPCLVLLAAGSAMADHGSRCEDKQKDCVEVTDVDGDGEMDVRVRIPDVRVIYAGDRAGGQPRFVSWNSMALKRGYLGVTMIDMTPELRIHFGAPEDLGVMVGAVEADSPAARAGLRVGDIITLVDGKEIQSSADLSRVVRAKEDGQTVDMEVWRDSRALVLSATVSERERTQYDLGGLFALQHLDRLEKLQDLHVDGLESLQIEPGSFLSPESLKKLQKALEKLDGRFVFNFDPDASSEAAERLREYFSSDAYRKSFQTWHDRESQLQKQIEALEERIQELEELLRPRPSQR